MLKGYKSVVLVMLGVVLSVGKVNASECKFKQQLDVDQREAAQLLYKVAAEYDLGYTAVAMAWQESTLNKYPYRKTSNYDHSVGVLHNLVHYNTKGMSKIEKQDWINRMQTDIHLSVKTGVDAIRYWKKHSKSYTQMLARFNGGWKGNIHYANKVKKHLKKVVKCDWTRA